MNIPPALQSLFEPWLLFLAEDPSLLLVQILLLLTGATVIFLVFYTTRDILLRTNSFLYMFVSIVLVAAVPIVGFFLYLLIRPSRTIKEKETELMLKALLLHAKKDMKKAAKAAQELTGKQGKKVQIKKTTVKK